jgi:hypothetical protein
MTTPMATLAKSPTRPEWYRKSGIVECDTCEGNGSYWNGRGLGGNDPDSWDIECEGCDGAGHFACATCGNDVQVSGYDCAVCDLLYECPDLDVAVFAAALKRAKEAHQKEVVR